MLYRTPTAFGVCVLLGGLAAAGCGSRTPEAPPSEIEKKLDAIGDAYLRATVRLHKPPQNLDDLLPSLQEFGNPDDLLRSPDDNQPFEIVWGVELRRLKARGSDIPIIAFEKVGKDGKRHVLRGRSEVLRLTTGELKSARFPDGYNFPF
jgi:hypothetical protein